MCIRDSFWTAYQQNRDLLRFHYHRPREIWENLKDLDLPRRTFSSDLSQVPTVQHFITEDEIDLSLIHILGSRPFSQHTGGRTAPPLCGSNPEESLCRVPALSLIHIWNTAGRAAHAAITPAMSANGRQIPWCISLKTGSTWAVW